MLGTKEIALRRTLAKWQKRINSMRKKLNAAINSAKDLESNKTHKACLGSLKKLKREMENEIKHHEYGIWAE